jgi:hypothetical protein
LAEFPLDAVAVGEGGGEMRADGQGWSLESRVWSLESGVWSRKSRVESLKSRV